MIILIMLIGLSLQYKPNKCVYVFLSGKERIKHVGLVVHLNIVKITREL